MRQEMALELAKFFKEVGLLNRAEFRLYNGTPYSLREVERIFKNYAVMLYHVGQVKLPEEEKQPIKTSPKPVIRPTRKQKVVKDPLDE